MVSTVRTMVSAATSRTRHLYRAIVVLAAVGAIVTGCATSTGGQGSRSSQSASASTGTAPTTPSSGSSSSGGVNTKKVTPPHVACLTGKQDLTLDGATRPTEICLRVRATASITIRVPAGKSWDAPKVNDPAMLAVSEQTASASTLHITIRGVDSGTASVVVTSNGATVWQLQVAIVT